MKRRQVLLTITGMFTLGRYGQAAVCTDSVQSIQMEVGAAARELQKIVMLGPETRSMVEMCNVLADRCQRDSVVSPAFAQATLDACDRSAKRLRPSDQTDRLKTQMNEFGRVVCRFIEMTAR